MGGGRRHARDWDPVARPGEPVDAYGCGDSFAGALAYGLGAGMALPDALHLAATCGAWCLCGRGPTAISSSAADIARASAS